MLYIKKDFYKLHKALVDLTKINECFYICTQEYKDYTIQSYTYRLASYTEFCLPYALECRGTTFVIDKKDNSVHMFARPFEKFFNAGENPFTADEVLEKLVPKSITEKMDGSLIMVGKLPNGEVIAKTKSTIFSEQAVRATEIINESEVYTDFCNHYIDKGYTPLFEYTAPMNQIVLFYPKEELTLIGLRSMVTGEYLDIQSFLGCNYCTKEDPHGIPVVKEYDITIEDIKNLQDTGKNEGYVVQFDNGQRMKFKTLSYILSHRAKDSIYNERNLSEIILSDKLDDIMPLIKEDISAQDYVNNFSKKLLEIKANISMRVFTFYSKNKELDRKNYALKAQDKNRDILGLLMNAWMQREIDINSYITKNELYKGIKNV